MSRISEQRDVQNNLIHHLMGMGWSYLPPGDVVQRRGGDETEPFLPDVLRTQLIALNPGLVTAANVNDLIRRLRLLPATLEGHEVVVRALRGLWTVYDTAAHQERNVTFIDYEALTANEFHFTQEIWVLGRDRRRMDMLLWVNCIIEGTSRTILAGMVSLHQDEIAILQLLHAAFGDYGTPWGIVSDNAAVFKAEAFMRVMEGLDIELCPIDSGQSWQNLIETQFNIQRRLADAKFKQAATLAEIQDEHAAAFIQLFNTTRHWAHRDRPDGRYTPVSVLAGRLGRSVDPHHLRRVFRHLQFSRVVNRHGYVSIQRFYIYAERGLTSRRVAIWLYENRLHVEYQQTSLARYHYRLDRNSAQISSISRPKLYRSLFASTQLEMFELDDAQWVKIWRRPEYARRRLATRMITRQLAFDFNLLLWLLLR